MTPMTTPSTSAQGPADRAVEIAHRWAQASYNKALGKPFEAFEPLQKQLRELFTASPSPAASPASPSGVRVKPLLWVDDGENSRADAGFEIRYSAFRRSDGRFDTVLLGTLIGDTRATLDEAKAAAQADYEARIMSALASDATPAPTSGSEDGGEPVALGPISRAMYEKAEWYTSIGRLRDTVFSSAEVLALIAALAKPASSPAGGDVREVKLWDILDWIANMSTDQPVTNMANAGLKLFPNGRPAALSQSTSGGRGE